MTASIPAARFREGAGALLGARALADRRVRVVAGAAAVAAVHVLLLHSLLKGLGGFWIADWDEGRHIANAMEMLRSGDWIVTRYQGTVDYFNLKPPASMWAIAASVHLFGASPFSVRLPSVVATVLTSVLCSAWAWRRRGPLAAVVCALAFASSLNLVDLHSGRTADPDAIFVLFVTTSVLASIAAVRRPWMLTVAVTAFSMAFLTKSYHAALVLVFAAAVLVVFRRSSRVRVRHLLVAAAGLLPVLVWAALRYSFDGTTFFTTMIRRDVLDRSRTTIEGHVGGPEYYLTGAQSTFGPWLLVILVALFVVVHGRSLTALRNGARTDEGRALLALAGWVCLVFAAFSAVSSKLAWYTLPAFPALCLLAALLVPMALRSSARPAGALLVVLVLGAVWLGQLTVQGVRLTETDQPAQVVLSRLASLDLPRGSHLYLDPVVPGGWSQSFTAVAEMAAPVQQYWTGAEGFLADTTDDRAVILVQDGSPAAQQVLAASGRVVAASGGWSLVQKPSGAS